MLCKHNLEGDPLQALFGGFLAGVACRLLQVGNAVNVLTAGGKWEAADDAALAPERLSHETETARSFVAWSMETVVEVGGVVVSVGVMLR